MCNRYNLTFFGSHCSSAEGTKEQDIFVAEIGYLARLR
jgi:hypothetical protein